MSPVMPMRFGRAFLLAVAGGIATLVCWFFLTVFFWSPLRHTLNRYGMYVHDIDGAYLVAFGPVIVVGVFFLTAVVAALFERRRFEAGREMPSIGYRILFFGLLPMVIVFALINVPHLDAWRFPLSETTVGVVGLCLGYLWVRWRRTDELPAGRVAISTTSRS